MRTIKLLRVLVVLRIVVLRIVVLCASVSTCLLASVASAQQSIHWDNARDNLNKMMLPIAGDEPVTASAEEWVKYLQLATGAQLVPRWETARRDGFDRQLQVTLTPADATALTLLERLLVVLDFHPDSLWYGDPWMGAHAWQLTESGAIEFGPKDILNRSLRRVYIDPSDLLYVPPNFSVAPGLQLTGNGSSPVGDLGADGNAFDLQTPDPAPLIELITAMVEPLQWREAGGRASIRTFRNVMIISAPGYMHRQIDGWANYSPGHVGQPVVDWVTSAERARTQATAQRLDAEQQATAQRALEAQANN